jgi:cobalamin biosynthesis Mg chelatase CobN
MHGSWFRGQTEAGNDLPISGVFTTTVEEDLVRENQTRLTGDNLVSVIGAEEDGVDNRVEAPTWASDGGSDSAPPGQQADNVEAPAQDSALPAAQADTASTRPDQDKAPSAGVSNGTRPPASDPAWRQAATSRTTATVPAPGTESAQWNSAGQRGPSQTTPLPAAVGAAAGAARGLVSRVSAPFTKPKPKQKPSKGRPPVGSGLPPRPQGWSQGRGPQAGGPQSRRAQLSLARIEPASVMKFSFLISLVGWVILVVAVAILYFAMSKLGVFTSIEHTVGLVTSNKSHPAGSNASNWFRATAVIGYTMLIGAINIVLITALATIGAVLYNLVAMLTGGIEVTLKESD